MRRWNGIVLASLAATALSACHGASVDPGLDADMRVANAQFAPEPFPDENGGPEIIALRAPHDEVLPGLRSERVTGALEPRATAIVLGLDGDHGYWIVTAGVPSIDEPDFPTIDATLSFARGLTERTLSLRARAVDARGRFGPEKVLALEAIDSTVSGDLVVKLSWDTNADLDLHVVAPDGSEIYAGDINSFKAPPPGSPPVDPNAWKAGGMLDLDSNGGCRIDGRREENLVWASEPAHGSYVVRVATPSLCAEDIAHWQVEALHRGKRVASAQGVSVASDTRFGWGRGAGVLALRFVLP